MCDIHTTPKTRFGSALEHGAAHTDDHARWSRRDFLKTVGLTTAGGAVVLGGLPVQAFGSSSLLHKLRHSNTDRILVLIQLSGGNDGLNTIIPINNDLYYQARPSLAIPKADTLALTDEIGAHPSFEALRPLYDEGHMAILHSVGYPSPDLSHFRSTDIWVSASESDEVVDTGWLGRYLEGDFPNFAEEPTDYPLGVQIGASASMMFRGESASLGMSIASVDLFEQLANQGVLYDEQNVPSNTFGSEIAFVRSVANDSFQYAGAIRDASARGINSVTYPENNALARSLSTVARLIKGNLGARIYHVALGSFDTHANQAGVHANLLLNLATSVRAFYDDLAVDGFSNTLCMTFSEFGRRVQQNGSNGTDHGTAAPLFLFGNTVEGGFHGTLPDLTDLDDTGNIAYQMDFRSVYATVLQDWFELPPNDVASVLGQPFTPLPLLNTNPGSSTTTERTQPHTFTLHQNYPNPFNPQTTLSYTLMETTPVQVHIYDMQGRLIQTLVHGTQPAGSHTLSFDATHLPSGTYIYQLRTPRHAQSRTMTLLR